MTQKATLPLAEIAKRFDISSTPASVKPLGAGLINDTFKVETASGSPSYVLQRINTAIFPDVDLLQGNIEAVTSHIRTRLLSKGVKDIDRRVLRFIPEKESGKTYFFDGKSHWRMSVFIDDALTFDAVTPHYAQCAGKAFGEFEAMLCDLATPLGETIPDFHNMELRLSQLGSVVKADPLGRAKEDDVRELLETVDANAEEMTLGQRLLSSGEIPRRICHCDTKVNNMLFDRDGSVLCVVDLDTTMPSFVFSDFGDFLRTGACTCPEDEKDLSKVDFDMDIFKAFSKGYIEGTRDFLTGTEKDNLPYAALLFPFMQAVRFLCDYIGGDTYYKTAYNGHNLVRARCQMRLFQKASQKKEQMSGYIDSLK